MVRRTRDLELALGDGVKRVEENERDAAIVQRRCLRLTRDVRAGVSLKATDVECLRPAEPGSLPPWRLADVVGSSPVRDMVRGESLRAEDLTPRIGAELPRC
jgi:N-acetylneuraminate synthase